jgi:formylglycine-generating enzyme required for sulfatase activity
MMVYIIIGIVVIYLIYLLFKFVIIPIVIGVAKISAVLGVITAVVAVGIALIFSLVNYFKSIWQNRDAYAGYVDSSPKKPDAETRRSYFFGPGYHQIGAIIKGTWSNHGKTFAVVKKWAKIPVLGWIFFIFFCVAQGVFGSIFTVIFSVLHFVVVFAFMCVFYFLFSIFWVFDRIVLLSNAIASRCPKCKHISVIPAFICPSCGRHHRSLVPGPYGVFVRRCPCGRILPTAFLTGRSKLEARCPRCESDLASGSATQFGVQLIGGSSAGKTVFRASFLHLYLKKVKALKGVSVKTHPSEDFDKLEQLFQEGRNEATNEMNAKMYSIVHTKGRSDVSHEFALYDVAGEVFAGQSTDSEQRQYSYCEGIILVVDPFSLRNVRQAYADLHQGREPVNFSETDVNDVVVGFINEYTRIGSLKAGQKSDIPVSVVIAKADVDVVKNEIGPQRIADTYRKNPRLYSTEKDTRDTICCDYLRAGGMDNMINNLTAQFKQIHYFPVSAMGHEQENSETYDPWGVLDAVLWIILERDQALAEIMGKKGAIIKKAGRQLAAAAMTTAMIAAVVLAGYFFISKVPVWFGSLTSKISFLNTATENVRIAAENARVAEENARIAAEKARIAAEEASIAARIAAEKAAYASFNSANFVLARAATFTMGNSSIVKERPEHRVTLKPFYISTREVTQAEYVELMGTNPSHFRGVSLPVECVTWYDAIEYCNARSKREGLTAAYTIDKTKRDPNNKNVKDNISWSVVWNRRANGYRLPTEAEWEYACRAGTTTPFHTGSTITTNQANYGYPNGGTTWIVGSGTANELGLYDMHGNVLEWCWDWYETYRSGAQTDPQGATSGSYRVQRGGSWLDGADILRSAFRDYGAAFYQDNSLGFRLVRNGE